MTARVLIAHADLRVGGGAEAVALALADRLRARGVTPGLLDRHGHLPPDGPAHRPAMLRLTDLPGLSDKTLLAWALVCRVLPRVAGGYSHVILTTGEGPRLVPPSLHLRHAPVLFSDTPAALAHLGAARSGPRLALRRAYARVCSHLARPDPAVARICANSRWTAEQAQALTGRGEIRLLYPPAPCPAAAPGPRDPLGLIALGRIVPNKRLEDAIAQVDILRARGWPVTLTILGRAQGRYARRFLRRHASHPHLRLIPDADPVRKAAELARASLGLHLYRGEHFGIAVAEMIAAGVLPVIHASGGVRELVPDPALQFHDAPALTATLSALLAEGAARRQTRLRALQATPALTAARAFPTHADNLLDDFLTGSGA